MGMFTRALSLLSPVPPQAQEARELPLSGINNPNQPEAVAIMQLTADGGPSVISGLPGVNFRTAPRLSAVYRSISIIGNTLGALPLHVYRDIDAERKERIRIPSERYLWGVPNPEATRAVFWSTLFAHCAGAGEAFIHVQRDGLKRPVELWPIHPDRVRIGRSQPDESGRRLKVYSLDGDTELPLVDYAQGGTVIHIPNLTLDGLHGLNPIAYMRRTLQILAASEEYGARIFSNGALPAGYLSTEADLEPAQIDKLRANWEKHHRGLENAYRTAVLDNGAKWLPTSIKPEEAQFLDTRHFQVEEVARIFGVPPHLLFESRGSTSWGSGLEEQTTGFVVFTLSHYSTRFEQAVSDQLLAQPENHYIRWNYGGLLRGRTLERYQAYQIALSYGILNPNEVRALEDLGPRDGGELYLRPANMIAPGAQEPAKPAGRSFEETLRELVNAELEARGLNP
ncbi:MAG: phage portal protein [Desulfurellales bacterium]|nr:MAG: phage portal protein [Desulfurellales bacterium]